MRFFTKKLTVPVSSEIQQIEVVQLWEVRWRSRNGEYAHNTRPEMEAFPSEEQAQRFADALRAAFKLVRHVGASSIEVRKAGSV